ncbi:hypothetical protein Sjap_025206 [Stephania japonica]|uniref:Uncharacterized protein n=1 Tax=Stephania japonica TaxID=461633 RepID=A0AAP0HJD9_9MAGN
MEFRTRDYAAEEASSSLPRSPTDDHPLLLRPSSNQVSNQIHLHRLIDLSASNHIVRIWIKDCKAQGDFLVLGESVPGRRVDVVELKRNDFDDPLRRQTANEKDLVADVQGAAHISKRGLFSYYYDPHISQKEWGSFKTSLMQKFPASKMVSVSSISGVIIKSAKANEKSSTKVHIEELNDPQKFTEGEVKVISWLEFVERLRELKDEIRHAWGADDRVTSLKLSIKVAKLLMDTSVSEFYPTLFFLVTDVMDMLGDMITSKVVMSAPMPKKPVITGFAKLAPYMNFFHECHFVAWWAISYLELAILHCSRFLNDQPFDSLHRLTMMMRGLADPLASAYCRVYMARCAMRLRQYDIGYLITCFRDFKIILSNIILEKDSKSGDSLEKRKQLIGLMEPAIGWIMKCVFKGPFQHYLDSDILWCALPIELRRQIEDILMEFGLGTTPSDLCGNLKCISIVVHHLIEELPAEIVCSHVLEIIKLIEGSNDISFDQYLNFRLLGFKLYEVRPEGELLDAIIGKVLQVINDYDDLDSYLKVADAYFDIVLQGHMDSYLAMILDNISRRTCGRDINENELSSLQSIFIKLLAQHNDLDDLFVLKHFVEILDVLRGNTRDVVNMHILRKATRNACICEPAMIQFLFETSQALHDGIDISNMRDDHQQAVRLIIHFVEKVDYGAALERHLTFLLECRGAFGRIKDLKEALVHCSNCLAVKAIKDANKHSGFVKSCIAFSEVTIPSVPANMMQMNLYIETAEVALLAGLVSHADGLVDSAVSCLRDLFQADGSQVTVDINGIILLMQRLFSLLVALPGNPERGAVHIPKSIISFCDAQPWITPRMRTKFFCSVVTLSAALSQEKLSYHVNNEEVPGNDLIFFGDPSYYQELMSISRSVLEKLVDNIQLEKHSVARGNIALEACNCILSSFKASDETLLLCSKLIGIAKSCSNPSDKYLRSTINVFDKYSSALSKNLPVISI